MKVEETLMGTVKYKDRSLWISTIFVLSILFTLFRSEASQSSSSSNINFNLVPIAGQDAFWAHNPKNPDQKILLVPSYHYLNLRFVNPVLAEAMKNSQVLIVEGDIKESSNWDDTTMIRAVFPEINMLKKYGWIKDNPILFQGLPWTETLNTSVKEFLDNAFKPILHPLHFTLDNIHPLIVLGTVSSINQNKISNIGMDRQLYRYFELNNKTIKWLETMDEAQAESKEQIEANYMGGPGESANKIEIYNQIYTLVMSIQQIDQLSPQEMLQLYEGEFNRIKQLNRLGISPYTQDLAMNILQRNSLWLSRLLEHFKDYKDESIVIVVGSGHFPGNAGLLKLLADQGFTFTQFSGKSEKKPVIVNKGGMPASSLAKEKTELAIILVDSALKKGLPQVIEYDISSPKQASEFKAELINIMVRLLTANPQNKDQQNIALLKKYIEIRNQLFNEVTLLNKPKALEELEQNPSEFLQMKPQLIPAIITLHLLGKENKYQDMIPIIDTLSNEDLKIVPKKLLFDLMRFIEKDAQTSLDLERFMKLIEVYDIGRQGGPLDMNLKKLADSILAKISVKELEKLDYNFLSSMFTDGENITSNENMIKKITDIDIERILNFSEAYLAATLKHKGGLENPDYKKIEERVNKIKEKLKNLK